jgi:nickel/cobalt transporter (NicO) family protein
LLTALVTGSILLSLMHAIIPNHWLPILAIARQQGWPERETLRVTLLAGLAHVGGTVLIGILLGWAGHSFSERYAELSSKIIPSALILMGLFFMWQHHTHHHFHINENRLRNVKPHARLIWSLAGMMFLSPCLEIEAFFLSAGELGWWAVGLIAVVYAVSTVTGMIVWMTIALHGLQKFNWHRIEHNAGLITGILLILVGLVFWFVRT